MRSHEESHGDDLQDHFYGVDQQKDQIDLICDSRHAIELFIQCEEHAVSKNEPEDYPVEPVVDGDNLNNLVPERIGHREAT